MAIQTTFPAKPQSGGLLLVLAAGTIVALGVVVGITLFRPTLIILGMIALALLVLSLAVPDRKAYWTFMLVLSILFDVGKRLTTGIVNPFEVNQLYGPPSSGTFSLDVYSTDFVLLAMLLPWFVRVCLRREQFYFPKFGYLFLAYLAWALIASLLQANLFYLSLFEWVRQIFYFLYFVCIINNVTTRNQLRAAIIAIVLGMALEAGTVIVFFEQDIGTETTAFGGLYRETDSKQAGVTHYESEGGTDSKTKRSAGTFIHPAQAAYYLEFTMLIVLASLVAVRGAGLQALLGGLFAAGLVAVYVTFSRSGLIGLIFGIIVFFGIARRARLISHRAFSWAALMVVAAIAAATPLLVTSLIARPQAATYRLDLLSDSLDTYRQHVVTGSGLAAVVVDARKRVAGKDEVRYRTIHNHYLIVLTETGPLGFFLFFGFFWQIAKTAFRWMKAADAEMKVLLVGTISGLAAIAMHNMGDGFGGHTNLSMLWLYAGLVVAIARMVQAQAPSAAPVAADGRSPNPGPGRAAVVDTGLGR